jgi:phosphinothricin acetyltransferase
MTHYSENNEFVPAIRLATESDAGRITDIYALIVSDTIISFEWESPTADEMRGRIENTLERFPWLVYEPHGSVLGYAYAGAHRSRGAYQWSVDVSAYVHEEERRQGVGRALYTSLFAILALQGFYNACAGIALPNPASVGMHESVGFRPVGVYRAVGYKFDAWHDVGWWQLTLQDKTSFPESPVDLPEVLASEEWRAALASGLPLVGGDV